jgi:hypothetical protein
MTYLMLLARYVEEFHLDKFDTLLLHLLQLTADSSQVAKNGADLLDRLIKDIVAERTTSVSEGVEVTTPDTFSLPAFIPLLSERIKTLDPFARMFLISWISVLNSLPDLQLVRYIADFVSGMFRFLSDPNEEVRRMTHSLLKEFLKEIKEIELAKESRREKRRKSALERESKASSIEGSTSSLISRLNINDDDNPISQTSNNPNTEEAASPPPEWHSAVSAQPTSRLSEDLSAEKTELESAIVTRASSIEETVNNGEDDECSIPELDISINYGKITDLLRPYLTSNGIIINFVL